MTSASVIRSQFIDFFKSKDHTFIPSSPVVPQDDPTLLFTNAGMNQFKSIFLGENKQGLTRAANSQKCMRVSGKHNDLEEVGRDHYHHTFFEMLGNWSFGNYYKKEAISWAWELLTGIWKLPRDKLYATVYKNDGEAIELWKTVTDIDHTHIGKHDEKSNFWEMGETGPCGPCSEIHMDLGTGICPNENKPGHTCGVNVDGCARYIELWNLVFMQYNRQKDGKLNELPNKHIDTGMGFERIVRVIQGKNSNYDTDLFMPIIAELEALSGKRYNKGVSGTPFRVIADHVRSLVFSITDGAFPANEGRGYVVRRLLRRAFRFGRELGFTGPFLYKLVGIVNKVMGDAFPEIRQRTDYVTQVIRAEEDRFGQTLEQGIELFNQAVSACKTKKSTVISGNDVFVLYDTYGFPVDLTRLMAEEQGLAIDEAGYKSQMQVQRDRARESTKKGDTSGLTPEGWTDLKPQSGTEFVGYNADECSVSVVRYKQVGSADSKTYLCVLDKTPFYAESGGQVGDTGVLCCVHGMPLVVEDTIKWNDTIVHKISAQELLTKEQMSAPFTARIDTVARNATRKNHSATHLLQAALRAVLGDHVQQSGSRVDPYALRFDFTHFKQVSQAEIAAIETMVNEWVLADYAVTTRVLPVAQAKAEGAMALFGEKYGDSVRVVGMGAVSKELCGGTHIASTGQIGLFHITAESSTSAGVRRIEAITGLNSLALLQHTTSLVRQLTTGLKVNEQQLLTRVTNMVEAIKQHEETIAQLVTAQSGAQINQFIEQAQQNRGAFAWLVKEVGTMDKKSFSGIVDMVSDTIKNNNLSDTVIVLGAFVDDKIMFAASAGQEVVQKFGVHCGDLVKMAAQLTGGSGGGNPVRAQAGGKDSTKTGEALRAISDLLSQRAKA